MKRGHYIITNGGHEFYPLDDDPGIIELHDIAHNLSFICRWTGSVSHFYSVAEHSAHVAALVAKLGGSPVDIAQAWLHDATEAYTNDVSRPVKHHPDMVAFREAEKRLNSVIMRRFGLPEEMTPLVKMADDIALGVECYHLMPPDHELLRKYWEKLDHTYLYAPFAPKWGINGVQKFLAGAIEAIQRAGGTLT